MTGDERILYHQIHPLKLITDTGTAIAALYLLWERQPIILAMLVAFVPSIIVTIALLQWGSLERYKNSPLGRYVARHMTRQMQLVRILGFLIMAVGALQQQMVLLPVGLAVILFAWLRGLLPGRRAGQDVPR